MKLVKGGGHCNACEINFCIWIKGWGKSQRLVSLSHGGDFELRLEKVEERCPKCGTVVMQCTKDKESIKEHKDVYECEVESQGCGMSCPEEPDFHCSRSPGHDGWHYACGMTHKVFRWKEDKKKAYVDRQFSRVWKKLSYSIKILDDVLQESEVSEKSKRIAKEIKIKIGEVKFGGD